MKRKVIIVLQGLSIGGVQKSCMTALNAIDYTKNEVTLYVRKNRLDILGQVNPNVRVIVNRDATHYYRKPKSIWYQCLYYVADICGLGNLASRFKESLAEYINREQIEYERKHYLKGLHFDVAISYNGGYDAVLTATAVNAEKKHLFFHGSEDEYHNVHSHILPTFDDLIGVSDAISSLIRQWYPDLADKVSTIENYVDDTIIREKAQERIIDTKRDGIVLCTCGRFAPVKGFDLAVEAAKIIKKKQIEFKWYFVGDGPGRPILERMIQEYDLGNNIILTGMQQNPYPYINCCDVYVQPSRAEAQPLTLIEAQILCKPCISTKTVGGTYIIDDGKTGLLAEISAESIANAVINLIDDISLRESIVKRLKQIDYAIKREAYIVKWNNLLR